MRKDFAEHEMGSALAQIVSQKTGSEDDPTPNEWMKGMGFSKEFESLMQYIALSSGNTNMPDGVKNPTFRPSNLPQKTPEEEKLHQKLVEENRK